MPTQADYEHHDGRPIEDHIIHLSGLDWDDYERLLDAIIGFRDALRQRAR